MLFPVNNKTVCRPPCLSSPLRTQPNGHCAGHWNHLVLAGSGTPSSTTPALDCGFPSCTAAALDVNSKKFGLRSQIFNIPLPRLGQTLYTHQTVAMPITILQPSLARESVVKNHTSDSESDSEGGVDLDGDISMTRPAKRVRRNEAILTPGEVITEDPQWMR
jgi:hypothetical protein